MISMRPASCLFGVFGVFLAFSLHSQAEAFPVSKSCNHNESSKLRSTNLKAEVRHLGNGRWAVDYVDVHFRGNPGRNKNNIKIIVKESHVNQGGSYTAPRVIYDKGDVSGNRKSTVFIGQSFKSAGDGTLTIQAVYDKSGSDPTCNLRVSPVGSSVD